MWRSVFLTIFIGKQQNRNPAAARIGCSFCRKIAILGYSTRLSLRKSRSNQAPSGALLSWFGGKSLCRSPHACVPFGRRMHRVRAVGT